MLVYQQALLIRIKDYMGTYFQNHNRWFQPLQHSRLTRSYFTTAGLWLLNIVGSKSKPGQSVIAEGISLAPLEPYTIFSGTLFHYSEQTMLVYGLNLAGRKSIIYSEEKNTPTNAQL